MTRDMTRLTDTLSVTNDQENDNDITDKVSVGLVVFLVIFDRKSIG
jgi:hypothetical protein